MVCLRSRGGFSAMAFSIESSAVRAVRKAIADEVMLMADGTPASVTHQDTLRRHDGGWRISRRVITPQRTPLGGVHLTDAGTR